MEYQILKRAVVTAKCTSTRYDVREIKSDGSKGENVLYIANSWEEAHHWIDAHVENAKPQNNC